MAMTPRSSFALAALLAAAPSLTAQTPPPAPAPSPARAEVDDLRVALETALGRTGRVALLPGARSAGRAYRLKGYGAVIVLAPRALPVRHKVVRRTGPLAPRVVAVPSPAVPRMVITVPEGTFDVELPDLGDLEQQMEAQMAAQAAALREMEAAQEDWSRAHENEVRARLRAVEEQAEAFRREAERARRRAEREVRTRLVPPVPPAAPPAPTAPPAAAARPAEPAPEPAPVIAPEPPEPPEAPEALEGPPPPWRFWFDFSTETETPDPADADAQVAAVRETLAASLASYRGPLASLAPDDFVTVALDFVPDRLLRTPPSRTLLVRVRARDLQARQAGRLTAAELRKRIEFEEN
jgi:hypothetical protein